MEWRRPVRKINPPGLSTPAIVPTNRFRPWIAAAFAFLYPGLGHVYLRSWFRAAVWFALALATAWLVVPADYLAAVEQNGLDGILTASETLPLSTVVPLLVVRALNVVDAYLTAARQAVPSPDGDEGPPCPHCRKPLDEDLDFCPWCTTRFDTSEENEDDVEIVP